MIWLPHSFCVGGDPVIIWGDAITNVAIWLAYFAIPTVLIVEAAHLKTFASSWLQWQTVWFAIFIVSCGTGHLMDAINFWQPHYDLKLFVNAVTAISSWRTFVYILPLLRLGQPPVK